jgi:hypothetical protein
LNDRLPVPIGTKDFEPIAGPIKRRESIDWAFLLFVHLIASEGSSALTLALMGKPAPNKVAT